MKVSGEGLQVGNALELLKERSSSTKRKFLQWSQYAKYKAINGNRNDRGKG
jgi:hypothetical protein